MGDLIGEVKMIVSGFVTFGGGLLMSAIAVGGPLMISGRAVQGIGIGISAPATLSIVVNSFPVAQRGFAVGVWGFAHGLGLLVGPLFAAWMMDVASWRAVFWVALPLTALVIAVTLLATRGYRSVIAGGKYDWLGLILGATGVTLLTYGLQNSAISWSAIASWGSVVAGIALLGVFGVLETRIAHPLVDFSLWRERLFSGGFFAESAVGFIYIPFLTFIGSLYLIGVLARPADHGGTARPGGCTGLGWAAFQPGDHPGADGDSVGPDGDRCRYRVAGLQHRGDVRGRCPARRFGLGADADDLQHSGRTRGRCRDIDHRHNRGIKDLRGAETGPARRRHPLYRRGTEWRHGPCRRRPGGSAGRLGRGSEDCLGGRLLLSHHHIDAGVGRCSAGRRHLRLDGHRPSSHPPITSGRHRPPTVKAQVTPPCRSAAPPTPSSRWRALRRSRHAPAPPPADST
ncbi:MAG: MFS transporter [Actinomycetia bacterium]|nr:MFS transporter [Actinomycetes bacterium]